MDMFQIEQLALAAVSLYEKQTPLTFHTEYETIECENTSVRSFVLRSSVAYNLNLFVCFLIWRRERGFFSALWDRTHPLQDLQLLVAK